MIIQVIAFGIINSTGTDFKYVSFVTNYIILCIIWYVAQLCLREDLSLKF